MRDKIGKNTYKTSYQAVAAQEKDFLQRAKHGGTCESEKVICDFSVNVNPLGMPQGVKKALESSWECFESYPDTECRELRKMLSEKNCVPVENIVCGNGASDLLYRICSVKKFKHVLLPVPAFSEYERALTANGSRITYLKTSEVSGFTAGENEIAAVFSENRRLAETGAELPIDAVFICNPANPSGKLLAKDTVRRIAEICAENDASLLADECFLPFIENSSEYSAVSMVSGFKEKYEIYKKLNISGRDAESMEESRSELISQSELIIIRAFTKIYAMAGLRLGYAVFSSEKTAGLVSCSGAPWMISGPAQTAGRAALKEDSYIDETVRYIAEQRSFIEAGLCGMGLRTVEGQANYVLFYGPPGLAEKMEAQGIPIRDCSDYAGLCTGYYRVAVRTKEENTVMLDALRRCL